MSITKINGQPYEQISTLEDAQKRMARVLKDVELVTDFLEGRSNVGNSIDPLYDTHTNIEASLESISKLVDEQDYTSYSARWRAR